MQDMLLAVCSHLKNHSEIVFKNSSRTVLLIVYTSPNDSVLKLLLYMNTPRVYNVERVLNAVWPYKHSVRSNVTGT